MSDGGPLSIARMEAVIARVPLEAPVRTAFGVMPDRPAIFLSIEDRDGVRGWGEIWCNFPSCGAEHRARLAAEELAPLLFETQFDTPRDASRHLAARSRLMVLQSGEDGPFAQALAGLDMALWDLAGRRAGVPLRRMLNPQARDAVAAYASGMDLAAAPDLIATAANAGFSNFKVKVGVRAQGEPDLLRAAAAAMPVGGRLMTDGNQGWNLEEALAFAATADLPDLGWLEEPLAADASDEDWSTLAAATPWPLAAGENVRGDAGFDAQISGGAIKVLQPDAGKWGGVTGCYRVACRARDAGLTYCPHFLGGAIGLQASAELLAAVGGDGLLEVDSNPNPLRTDLTDAVFDPTDGVIRLSDAPGLGIEPRPAELDRWAVARFEAKAN